MYVRQISPSLEKEGCAWDMYTRAPYGLRLCQRVVTTNKYDGHGVGSKNISKPGKEGVYLIVAAMNGFAMSIDDGDNGLCDCAIWFNINMRSFIWYVFVAIQI